MTKIQGDKDSPFTYTGHFWHAQSGLNLTLFRAYDPNLGRWISRDPIQEAGGINTYLYVSNNVIKRNDRLGLYRDCDAEHIDCFRRCYSRPQPCEDRDSSDKQNKWARYVWCQTKCLLEYQVCNAENALEAAEENLKRVIDWCSANPISCTLAIAAALAAVAAAEAVLAAAAA